MLNILFINPPNKPFSSRGILIEPIDTLTVATYVKSLGYNVSFLDMDVKQLTSADLQTMMDNQKIDVGVIIFDYHIPLHDEGSNQEIIQIINLFKKKKIVSIIGGKIATFFSEEQLKDWNADFFIQKDMEPILAQLLLKIKNKDSNIQDIANIRYKIKDELKHHSFQKININLNEFPIPDRKLCDVEDYIDVRTLLSSRGCSLKCTFCHVPGFWGNWKGKSARQVVDEIQYLKQKFQAEKILFLDDNAIAQPQRMIEIAQLLIKEKIKIKLGCLGAMVNFHEDAMKYMYEAGFRWIHYGAESGDSEQLKNMNKKIDQFKMLDVLQKTKEIGYRIRTSWILDMPDTTEKSLQNTEDMLNLFPTEEIRLHFLTLRLGSFLHEKFPMHTKQFIHNPTQNVHLANIDSIKIQESFERIVENLLQKKYLLISNPDDFKNVEDLQKKSPGLHIVSICPLRYGLNW